MAQKKEKETRGENEREDEVVGWTIQTPPTEALKAELIRAVQLQHDQDEETRAKRATEEIRAKRAHEETKTWKNGYLNSLEVFWDWQVRNERLFTDTVKQGLSDSRQLLMMWRNWMDHQGEQQQRTQGEPKGQLVSGAASSILRLTRKSTVAVVATVELLLKMSEAAMDSTFGYYESVLAVPSRKYVREINRQALDAVVPSWPSSPFV
jgi:hypothetical protein